MRVKKKETIYLAISIYAWLRKYIEKDKFSKGREICLGHYKEDLTSEGNASQVGGTAWVGKSVFEE